MSKQHKKPVFHEATHEPKEEFIPHDFEADDIIGEAPVAPQSEVVVQETSVVEPAPELPSKRAEEAAAGALPHGWRVISPEQHTGGHFLVTHDLEEPGIHALWKKTRSFSHNKWTIYGKWVNMLTQLEILPEPRFYKEIAR